MTSKKTTQERFNEILSFRNEAEKIQFEAEIFSLDIMYEVECLMKSQEFDLNKTQLANKLDVSKGYLTQLFTGDKLINLKTMAKLQRIFNIKFSVSHESIEKLKMRAMEKKYRKIEFNRNKDDWQKFISRSGKTYEFRAVPRKGDNGHKDEPMTLQGNG